LSERVIDLFEYGTSRWKGIGKRLAHADILAALAWKDECACH
jgi:hypothetical protein